MKRQPQETGAVRRTLASIAALVILGALATGVTLGYLKLRGLWLEQCVLRDLDRQVTIESGRRVKPDVIREAFGLKEGANLALVDFAARREEALRKYPSIKTIDISRRLPDGVAITVTEREPFVRVNLRNVKGESGRVADLEGVVFQCRRGTAMLPSIRENEAPGTQPGEKLSGHALAALSVLRVAAEPDFSELSILEIDTSRPDFLLLTLGNYSRAKLCWDGMDRPSPASDAELRTRLTNLQRTIATNLSPALIWNATIHGIVTADPNGVN